MPNKSLEPWVGLSVATPQPAPRGLGGVRVSPDLLQGSLYASCRYILRALLSGVDGANGDVIDATILSAIMDFNIGYLDDSPAIAWGVATYDQAPPNGYRRPTTVNAVAERLNLPHETARRRIDGLIAQGRCIRVAQGIYAPTIHNPRHHAGSLANYTAVRTLLRDLQVKIPEVAWPRVRGFEAVSDDPPVRLVNRRCAVYAVDTLAALAHFAGGYEEAMAYMAMVEATGRGAAGGVWPAVRASALARSLGQPIPSVRRRLRTLADRGLITPRGPAFDARPAREMESEVSRVAVVNLRRLHHLFASLEALETGRHD